MFNGDKVLFYQDTVSEFRNFSVLLDFVTVTSYLSKCWCLRIFSDKVSKDRKLLLLMKGDI